MVLHFAGVNGWTGLFLTDGLRSLVTRLAQHLLGRLLRTFVRVEKVMGWGLSVASIPFHPWMMLRVSASITFPDRLSLEQSTLSLLGSRATSEGRILSHISTPAKQPPAEYVIRPTVTPGRLFAWASLLSPAVYITQAANFLFK